MTRITTDSIAKAVLPKLIGFDPETGDPIFEDLSDDEKSQIELCFEAGAGLELYAQIRDLRQQEIAAQRKIRIRPDPLNGPHGAASC